MTIRTVDAGNGMKWITDGFSLFAKNPGMWVVLAVVLLIGTLILAFIPFLGGLVITLMAPVLVAGLLLGCRALDSGQPLELPHLWAGFQSGNKLSQLIIVGVTYLVASIVVMGIVIAAIGFPMMAGMGRGSSPNAGHVLAFMGSFLLGGLVALALLVPVFMAIWFAPALILFDNMNAVDAMKQSFSACLRNIVPFLLYGVIALVLNIVAAIPFGLGFLVLIPVLVCSLYVSYKDIFSETAPAASAATAADNPLLR